MGERSLTQDQVELENRRGEFFTYAVGAVPGTVIGAVAGFYGAQELCENIDFLADAHLAIKCAVGGLGTVVGGLAGDVVGGFSALGVRSLVRRYYGE